MRITTVAARVGVAFVVASVVAASGSVPLAGATAARTGLNVRVTPSSSLMDTALSIRVSGLRPNQQGTLRVTSVDAQGLMWSSDATFVADQLGVINPARLAPTVVPPGSYHGVRAMGLIESMEPPAPALGSGYSWGNASQAFVVTASVRGQHSVSTTVERSAIGAGVSVTPEALSTVGFFGQFWQPAPAMAKRPAILVFGGSGGGVGGLVPSQLAAHGYPTLAIAYFKEPGLPAALANIPLEYFVRALTWLGAQPDVDPRHIYVLSASRGTEAALLLGANFPNLVSGVIAEVPSNVPLCAFPTGCPTPAWTLSGRPLPFTTQFNNPAPTDNPAAVIPVERIRGPMLLTCGGTDQVWNSCPYAQAIMARLRTNHDPQPHVLLSYPHGGHGISGLVPYEPGGFNSSGSAGFGTVLTGATADANSIAIEQLWPKVLGFLADPASARSS
jgi:dienelactone hydrolase